MRRFIIIASGVALLLYGTTFLTRERAIGPWLSSAAVTVPIAATNRPATQPRVPTPAVVEAKLTGPTADDQTGSITIPHLQQQPAQALTPPAPLRLRALERDR